MNKHNEFKETEIGRIPKEWKAARLGDLAEAKGGFAFPPDKQGRLSGDFPFFKVSDMNLPGNEVRMVNANNWVDAAIVTEIKARTYPANAIIFPKIGGAVMTNKKRILTRLSVIDNNVMAIVIKKSAQCLPEFLLQWFNSIDLKDFANIGPLPSITSNRMSDAQLPLPSVREQRAIAYVLGKLQTAVETQEKIIATLRELKQATMAKLFREGLRGEPLKETEIGEMPESWEVARLGDVAAIRYGLGQPPELAENGVPMVRATDIKRGKIVDGGVLRVKRAAIPVSRNPFLKTGDIIVVRSGAYTGDAAAVTDEWEGAIAGYDLVVTPSEGLDSTFAVNFLLGERAQGYFRGQRDRSAQPHINAQQLSETLIPLPLLSDQRALAHTLQTLEDRLTNTGKNRDALQALFKAMLHQLMTGQIRVIDLEGMDP